MVDCVSETYRCDWGKVFGMNVYEFCNVLAYRTDKKNEEKRQIEEYRRR